MNDAPPDRSPESYRPVSSGWMAYRRAVHMAIDASNSHADFRFADFQSSESVRDENRRN
jgi:hypothetical protein